MRYLTAASILDFMDWRRDFRHVILEHADDTWDDLTEFEQAYALAMAEYRGFTDQLNAEGQRHFASLVDQIAHSLSDDHEHDDVLDPLAMLRNWDEGVHCSTPTCIALERWCDRLLTEDDDLLKPQAETVVQARTPGLP